MSCLVPVQPDPMLNLEVEHYTRMRAFYVWCDAVVAFYQLVENGVICVPFKLKGTTAVADGIGNASAA
eukprot:6208409-Pleurochrysis_carterae.AAC.2